MNSALIKSLVLLALLGMFSYLVLLKELWVVVSDNPNATFRGFSMNYIGRVLGGALIYLFFPAVVLIFKGRSFARYIIAVFTIGPIMFYFTVLGSIG